MLAMPLLDLKQLDQAIKSQPKRNLKKGSDLAMTHL